MDGGNELINRENRRIYASISPGYRDTRNKMKMLNFDQGIKEGEENVK